MKRKRNREKEGGGGGKIKKLGETHLERGIVKLCQRRLDGKLALILFVNCDAPMRKIDYGMFDRWVAREQYR